MESLASPGTPSTARLRAPRASPTPSTSPVTFPATFPANPIASVLLLAVALAILLLGGCSQRWSDFDRIEPPAGLSEIAETASWCESFDPTWWPTVIRAYDAHRARSLAIVDGSWQPFAARLAALRAQNKSIEVDDARRHLREGLAISAELGRSERELCAELRVGLPPEAGAFVDLLEARLAFWRATARWSDGLNRLAGPLELLDRPGPAAPSDAVVLAATDAYRRLAPVAAQLAERKAGVYFELLRDLEALAAESAAAESALKDGGLSKPEIGALKEQIGAVREMRKAREKQFDSVDNGEIDELLRLALRREGRFVAEAIGDDQMRRWALDRVDGVLVAGAPSRNLVEAAISIGRSALARREPRDPALEASFEAIAAEVEETRERLAIDLDAPSSAARRRAYESMRSVLDPVRDFFAKNDPETLKVGLGGLVAVAEGERSADEVLDARGNEPEEETPDLDLGEFADAFASSRPKEIRVLTGSPLVPSVLRALEADLGLPAGTPDEPTPFQQFIEAERTRLVEQTRGDLESLATSGAVFKSLAGERDPIAAARREIASIRAALVKVASADRAANGRAVAEAARLAGVADSDMRIRIASLRLALRGALPERMLDPSAEPSAGIGRLAAVDPIDVIDACGFDEATRVIAQSVVLDHADELAAAAAEARGNLADNLSLLLLKVIEASLEGRDMSSLPPVVATTNGSRAVEARLSIAADIGRFAGVAAERRFLEALAQRSLPGLLPESAAAYRVLDRFAAGRDAPGAAREESADLREVIGVFLDTADARRHEALRAAIAWRGGTVVAEAIEGRDAWRRAHRGAPVAWMRRQAIVDADTKAMLEGAAFLAGLEAPAEVRAALTTFERRPLRVMAPYFGEAP